MKEIHKLVERLHALNYLQIPRRQRKKIPAAKRQSLVWLRLLQITEDAALIAYRTKNSCTPVGMLAFSDT